MCMHLRSLSRLYNEAASVNVVRQCRIKYFGQLVRYILMMLHIVVDRPISSERWPCALMIPEILFLVEQIRPRTTQIYNLRAAISVFFQTGAFEAVEGVGDALRD
jgi:hypothetical protein